MELNPPKKKSHTTSISSSVNITIFKISYPILDFISFAIPLHLTGTSYSVLHVFASCILL